FMLDVAIYHLLNKHFLGRRYSGSFLETTFPTVIGILINSIAAPEDKVDLSKYL
ncbi:hypothetical protein EDD18DRAFT_1086961, partial [Armillaria luteobubalina]